MRVPRPMSYGCTAERMMMAFTDEQWADIMREDVHDSAGWVFVISISATMYTIELVAEARLDGSKRPIEEAKQIALEKARRSFVEGEQIAPPTEKLLDRAFRDAHRE